MGRRIDHPPGPDPQYVPERPGPGEPVPGPYDDRGLGIIPGLDLVGRQGAQLLQHLRLFQQRRLHRDCLRNHKTG